MSQFGLIVVLCQTNRFLEHNKLKVKHQGGDAELLDLGLQDNGKA